MSNQTNCIWTAAPTQYAFEGLMPYDLANAMLFFKLLTDVFANPWSAAKASLHPSRYEFGPDKTLLLICDASDTPYCPETWEQIAARIEGKLVGKQPRTTLSDLYVRFADSMGLWDPLPRKKYFQKIKLQDAPSIEELIRLINDLLGSEDFTVSYRCS